MSTNEAAERLRSALMEAYDGPPLAEVLADMDDALAAERRATVERLLDADDWKHEALKILDEEAAR